jgi:hypothetical protein
MTKLRPWIFRALILATAGLFTYAWFQWWWQAYVENLMSYLYIRPWGLFGDVGEMQALIEDAFLPGWFPILMWGVFAVLIALFLLVLVFSFMPNKEVNLLGRFRMSMTTFFATFTGVALIVVMAISLIMMIVNMKEWFDTPLQGQMFVDFGEEYNSNVYTTLLPAYYMAWATGPVMLVLAVLKRFIVGKNN